MLNPLFYDDYIPKTTVTVYTWRGETYDLTPSLFNWQRGKYVDQSQPGTFTLNLVASQDKSGKTYADLLMPMDYVEIRASKYGKKANGKLPIIMRGFVDQATYSLSLGGSGGPQEPRIIVTGRDFTKLLIIWQVLYLWTQNTLKASGDLAKIEAEASGFGLYFNFGLPLYPESIASFFKDMMAKMISPIQASMKGFKYPIDLPWFRGDFAFPDFPISSLNVLSYTGSYWNLLQYFASPPFGELFVWDDADGPVLTSRMAPYKTLGGSTPAPSPLTLESEGDFHNVSAINISRSDTDLYTYFLTYGASTQLVGLTMPVYVTGSGNGVITPVAGLFGVRPYTVDTSWIGEYDSSDPGKPNSNAIQIGDTLNKWLVDVMGGMQYFWSGNIACHGDENYRIGTYRTLTQRKQDYYIASIQDTFTVGSDGTTSDIWTANIGIVRGEGSL